jgi:CRISPR-associated protein Csx17
VNTIELSGCTPEPLMSYLKALGVFRLIAEQADTSARGFWRGGVFVLETSLDLGALKKFFLAQYKPTPVLAPWNGGSGFYGGGSEPLNAIYNSTNPALALYRDTILAVRQFIPSQKPKDDAKESLLIHCRAALSDEVLAWLDTCFVLGEDGAGFFPLLGTGGNDGRLEFTNNFMQRLAEVLSFTSADTHTASSIGWLESALFDNDPNLTAYENAAIGQFNPGGIGGANGVQGSFEANSRVNPWDYVLMIEGAIMFAGSVARRLGTNTTERAVFPFTVSSVAVGYGSATASEETTDGSRAELWLPLWDKQAGFAEVRQLFAEGRAQMNRRQAKNSVEFALAINLLGVSRGVTAFTRYGFLKRNGLAFLASPIGRVAVTLRPTARLLDDPQLQEWLDRFRLACRDKGRTPARYQTTLHDVDSAIFEFATRSQLDVESERSALIPILRALGRAERTLACGLAFCKEKYIRPLQGITPDWLTQADDGSPEFSLAAAVAGIGASEYVGPLRVFLEEVETKGTFFNWSPGSTSAVWSKRPLADNLAAVFLRRQMETFRAGQAGVPLNGSRRSYPIHPAPLDAVLVFLNALESDHKFHDKLHDLIWGLSTVAWGDVQRISHDSANLDLGVPPEFGLPRLLVNPLSLVPKDSRWLQAENESDHGTKPDPEVFQAIAVGRADGIQRAANRLRSGGLSPVGQRNGQTSFRSLAVVSPYLRPGSSSRLLASMLFPLSNRDLLFIANAVLYPPESEE